MAEKVPQTLANHGRLVAPYHFGVFGVFAVNFVYAVVCLVRDVSFETVLGLAMAATFIAFFLFVRVFPLKAQDRIIRLEERLRLGQLLPDDLKPRIAELELSQLIALRFASDDELVELVRKVVDEGIKDRATIKKMIRTWRPDYLRV